MSPSRPAMAAPSTWRPPPTSGAQLYARSPSPVPVAPEMPNLRGVRDRISELLLANYALTGNAEWIGIRDRATTIFAVQPPATAAKNLTRASTPPPQPRPILFPPPLAPTPRRASLPLPSLSAASGEWETDSTRILDVSMMLDGNYNATADPEWLQIGSRLRSCYRDDCPVFG